MRTITGIISVACLLLAGVPAWAATAPKIGTAAVAEKDVTGTLGSERRSLKRGDGVFQNENIATGKDAGAQLLFNDETALTLGPNTQVILDSFAYDPNRKTGEMSLRAMTGAFRFVSGSAPSKSYKIKTPVGTIGVRGTIIQFWVSGQQLILQLDEGTGAYFCNPQNKCAELNRPGTYVVVTSQQVGGSQSKYGKECGSSGGANCYVTGDDQTLYISFLGLGRFLNDLTPGAGPNFPPNQPPPGNGPPNQPPPGNGPPPAPPPGSFSPMINPGIGTPPGLAGKVDNLPRGLRDRCAGGSCTAPGRGRKP